MLRFDQRYLVVVGVKTCYAMQYNDDWNMKNKHSSEAQLYDIWYTQFLHDKKEKKNKLCAMRVHWRRVGEPKYMLY